MQDRHTHPALARARLQGIEGLRAIEEQTLYLLGAELDGPQISALASEILSDPVAQEVTVAALDGAEPAPCGSGALVEVAFRPGVTDTAAESLLIGARRAGFTGVQIARSLRRYLLESELAEEQLRTLAGQLLLNDLIEM